MKEYYADLVTDYPWLIKAEGWVKSLQGIREAQLALGNGLLGSRSVLEELPNDAKPGTYIAGLYDRIGSQVAELVNLPNPFNFKIMIEGEKLGVATMDVVEHKRILNLRHGLLWRHTVFQDTKKKRYDYQSLRFLSMHNKKVGVMQIIFTPLDNGIRASVETGIDTSVYNTGTITEGRKRHFRIREVGQYRNEGYLLIETFGKLNCVIFRSGFYYQTQGKKILAKDNIFEIKLRKNQTIVFTKIFYIDAITIQEDLEKRKRASERGFRKAYRSKFASLLNQHIHTWEDLWKRSEVSIWGDPEIEKNVRFNIYHMLICAPCDEGSSSIGARTLTGEGYHGHIFWDAEIYLLPFYLYTMPDAAKNMLLYRYKRLDVARGIAKRLGYKGAMFPWESAGLGEDETPGWAKDLDGKIIKIQTGKMQHHITADIAYAFQHYYNVTLDERFLKDYGYEVLFETARFWASRVEYNKRKKLYEIKNVIGPDEFHKKVNNNAYTNMMAKWNLLIAYKTFSKAKKLHPRGLKNLTKKIGLSEKELADWKKISSRMSFNMKQNQIIEQFDGFFRKRKIKITKWDENFIPMVTERISPRDYDKTQLVKQADVVMLLYLLSDVFTSRTKKKNYEYYVDRTIHQSSLSLPIYALMAIEVGDRDRGYRFFFTALHTDISNIHNNTNEGIHSACLGGVWQVLINGFAGIKIHKEILSVVPRLPRRWRKVLFSLQWRGDLIKFEVTNTKVEIQAVSQRKRRKIRIKVFGILHELRVNKDYKFKRKIIPREERAYYL